ncbi:MAG: hypothetical protein IPN40_14585 [Uliginosibacterium sp.]|jgi:hypothetical protein|nr:hypothetical protein [Uliginosibacterium sp.]
MQFTHSRSSSAVDFNQASQCLAFLQHVNATNVEPAMAALLEVLEGMATASPEPAGHLQVLEEARQTLDFVLGEAAKRYASRPLPPLSVEDEVLQKVTRLWSIMATNYGFVAQRASSAVSPGLEEQRALLTQRRIQYHTLSMIEYFRARREMPVGLWQDLHSQYLAAERAGVVDVRVPDTLNETWGAQSAKECYVAALLIDAASPYSRTPREFTWVVRWAQRFAPYCALQAGIQVQDKNSTFVLDIASDCGLRPYVPNTVGESVFSLNTAKLATHIHAVVNQLKKGVSAASLGLGEDCVQPACARLLVSLYRPWGLASSGRRFPRHRASQQAQVCADPVASAFFITGKQFDQDGRQRIKDFTRSESMLTLGELVESGDLAEEKIEVRAAQLGYSLETWDIVDQSVAGFKMVRQEGASRVEHRQLIGLRIPRGERLLLAEISWLQYRQDGSLSAGISVLPSPPAVAAVRITGNERGIRDQYRLGFIIPPVPALKTNISMLIPAGWFQSDRRLAVQVDGITWQARLEKLVSRGANFDRVSFIREEIPGGRAGGQ